MHPQRTALSTQQLDAFREDGFLILRQAIPAGRIAAMQALVDRVSSSLLDGLADEGLIDRSHAGLPWQRRLCAAGRYATRWGRSWRRLLNDRAVFDLHHSPALVAALHDLLGPTVYGHSVFNGRPKLPGQGLTVVPWHQDSAYFGAETANETIITTWLPLVPVSAANGCMEVARGSHRRGLIAHDQVQDEAGFLDIRGRPDPATVEICAMQPGDALLMHNLTWHASGANSTDDIRWSIDLRFHGEGADGGRAFAQDFPEPMRISDRQGRPAQDFGTWHRQVAALTW